MPDLYSVVHYYAGSLATFPTKREANEELVAVVRDEPMWEIQLPNPRLRTAS